MQGLRLGRHALVRPLGRGGFGEVWATGEDRALKILTRGAGPELEAALLHEVRSLGALDHPHVVTLLDLGRVSAEEAAASEGRLAEGAPWLLMERAEGGSLSGWPRHTWAELVPLADALLDALAHIHARGLLHLDVKPPNVLLHEGRAWLADLGISAVLASAEPLARRGSLPTMAPEQLLGRAEDFGPETDLYALGATLLGLLLGRNPYPARSVQGALSVRQAVWVPTAVGEVGGPPEAAEWLGRLLDEDPTFRFPSAAHARAALPAPGRPPRPPALSARAPRGRWPRRRPAPGPGVFGLRVTRFVGREAAQAQLWEALRTVQQEGGPRHVVVTGPPGCGRSRLLRWLCEAAHASGLPRPWLAAHSAEGDPEEGLLPAARRSLGALRLDPPALLALCRRLSPGDAWALVDLLDPEIPLSDAERHARLLALARARCLQGPLVVALDDAEHAEDARRWLRMLRAADPPLPVLVVETRSDGLAPDCDAQLRLGDLSPLAARDLVADLLSVESTVADSLATQLGGRPGLLVASLREAVRRGDLRPGAGGALPPLPGDLLGLGRAALAASGLGEAAVDALARGAALGARVRREEWAAACGSLPTEARRAAEAWLLSEGHAEVEGPLLRWRRPEVRRACLARAGTRTHAACAGAVADPGRRGRHLVRAGQAAAAVGLLSEAVDTRLDQGRSSGLSLLLDDLEAALDAVEAGPHDPRRLAMRSARARRLRVQGRLDEAEALAREVRAAARASGAHLPGGLACLTLSAVVERRGDYAGANAFSTEAADFLEAAGDRLRAACARLSVATTWASVGEAERARAALAHIDLDGLLSDPDPRLVPTLLGMGVGQLTLVAPEAGVAFLERAVGELAARGERFLEAMALIELGEADRRVGAFSRARQRNARATRLLEQLGYAEAAIARLNEGICAVEARADDADAVLAEALDGLVRIDHHPAAACAWAWRLADAASRPDLGACARALDALDALRDRVSTGEVDTLGALARSAAALAQADRQDLHLRVLALQHAWQPQPGAHP